MSAACCYWQDLDLDGAQSLGGVQGDGSFVWLGQGLYRLLGSLALPRLRETAALQVIGGYQSFDQELPRSAFSPPFPSFKAERIFVRFSDSSRIGLGLPELSAHAKTFRSSSTRICCESLARRESRGSRKAT